MSPRSHDFELRGRTQSSLTSGMLTSGSLQDLLPLPRMFSFPRYPYGYHPHFIQISTYLFREIDHKKSKEEQQVRRELDTLLNTLLPIFKIYIIFLKSHSLRVLDYVHVVERFLKTVSKESMVVT